MTKEDKQLLLKDLCARLPYGVICKTEKGDGHLCSINQTIFGTEYGFNVNPLKRDYFSDSETEEQVIKPYLRPMSSMTEEEKRELQSFYPGYFGSQWLDVERGEIEIFECSSTIKLHLNNSVEIVDWFNSHHFDYRGLIEKGLALEATEGMYKTK